jgi:S1-C subfamily serine protease
MKTQSRTWPRYLLPVAAAVAGVLAVASFVLALAHSNAHTTRVVERTRVVQSSTPSGLNTRRIYAKDAPGVAFVQSSGITTNSPFGRERGVATGSGFVLDRRGDILTNAHVVNGARTVSVRFGGSGSEVAARVVGTDNSNDLAVLRVDPNRVKLHPLALAGSSSVHVGDPVAAIGNPFGFDRTITAGIVSALQRQITAPDGFTINHVIQTDAAINPGNSGGPLINTRGQVVGINSQIATGGNGDANVGIGFAIPIATAKHELGALERGGTVQHAFLGVGTVPGNGGVVVKRVESGSPAAKAGLRKGDLIVSLAGRPIRDPSALAVAVGAHKPGETVTVGYVRHGVHGTVSATLARHPTAVLPSSGLGG